MGKNISKKIDITNIESVCNSVGVENRSKIYYHKDVGRKQVFEIINELLTPYGFESFSEGQFKRISGGSKNSSNLIKNYAIGRGNISNGYTYIEDIRAYCQNALENSVFIPLDLVVKEFEWAKTAINEGHITRYSGGGERYDIEAMIDIAKGYMPEVGFKIDAKENYNFDIQLNREFYGISVTDEGWDVHRIKDQNGWRTPKLKIQLKDVQYFMLVPTREFYGDRSADLYLGYKAHWSKAHTGQQFLRALGEKGEEIFSDYPPLEGIRVERRGWAYQSDFIHLPPGTKHKGLSFTNDNMCVYWDDLRDFSTFNFCQL